MVARATSAAPTYFKSVKIGKENFGDGGFGHNNPSWEAYNEVYDMHNSDDTAIVLVSVGTGESYVRRFAAATGYVELFQALRAAKGLATDTYKTDELLQKITQKRKDSYFRFNADERLGKIKLDCWKKARRSRASTADEIQQITESYMDQEEVTEMINRVAEILVQNRRMRATTERWAEQLFGIKWRCLIENCPEGCLLLPRSEFEDHLQNYHAFGPVADQMPKMREEYEDLIERGKYEAK
jgi:patatin-like phospholipase/acyl hydrolase